MEQSAKHSVGSEDALFALSLYADMLWFARLNGLMSPLLYWYLLMEYHDLYLLSRTIRLM